MLLWCCCAAEDAEAVDEPLQFPLSLWPASIGSTLTLHETWGCWGSDWWATTDGGDTVWELDGAMFKAADSQVPPATEEGGIKVAAGFMDAWVMMPTPPTTPPAWRRAMGATAGKKLWVRVTMLEPQLEEAEPQWLLPTELRLWPPKLTFRGMGIMLGWWWVATPLTVVTGLISVKRGICNQACLRTASRLGLLLASVWRHFRIRSWHSADSLVRKRSSALQICSSVSNGISPQTMSYNNIPRLQTVASSPL